MFRHQLLRFAQLVNRKTSWLDGLKSKIGIDRLVQRLLAPPVTSGEREKIIRNLRTTLVDDQVVALKEKGLSPDFWILLMFSMGDIVACEPIARYLKKIAPNGRTHWIVQDRFTEILTANPSIDEVVPARSLSAGKALLSEKVSMLGNAVSIDCHFDGTSCAMTNQIFDNPANPQINVHTHYAVGPLLGSFALAAGLPWLDDAPTFHFAKGCSLPEEIDSGCVVFHCHSNERCRDWDDAKWNELASWVVSKGLKIVEVGTRKVLRARKNVVDFTGYRTIQQVATIIKNAALFIGIDSVFGHVANATRTPAIILLGKYRNFKTYFPYSGDFARSPAFRIVRAPNAQAAARIPVETVIGAVDAWLQACAPGLMQNAVPLANRGSK